MNKEGWPIAPEGWDDISDGLIGVKGASCGTTSI